MCIVAGIGNELNGGKISKKANADANTKILKSEEISFKGHKTMYGEMINPRDHGGLPQTVESSSYGTPAYKVNKKLLL